MVKATKVTICGLKGIGKTTLLEQLIYGSHANQDLFPTVEDIYVASVDTDRGTKEVLRLYDTEGLQMGTTGEIPMLKPYYPIADAFVLMYRIDNRASFDVIEVVRKDIEKNREKREILIVAIGYCGRNNEARQVDPSSAIGWASREKFRHFEVSLSDRRTLVAPFIYIASKTNPPPTKSSFAPLGIGMKKAKEP